MNVETKRMRVDNTISFSDKDYKGVQTPHTDALVIPAKVAKWKIKRIMVDTGSSADILFNHCYEKIKHKLEPRLRPYLWVRRQASEAARNNKAPRGAR